MDHRGLKSKSHKIESLVVDGYKNGLSLHKLSKLHEVAPNTIRNILVANSVERRPRRPKKINS